MKDICAFSRFLARRAFLIVVLSIINSFNTAPASAQACGTDYVVKKDDSLTSIATKIYGDASQWRIIFYANQDRLEANIAHLAPGRALRIPCLGDAPAPDLPRTATIKTPSDPAPQGKFVLSRLLKRIEFLTAEGYAPMTGRALPNGGMLTDVISTSMELIKQESNGEFDYTVSWVNDWSSHLNPLLKSRTFDAGFPWERPDCDEPEELDPQLQDRCQRFFFSDAFYETFEVFYTRNNSTFKFESDNDVIGKRICLTIDNGLDDLDGEGRNWAKDGKITLIRPASLEECFRLLDQKAVDAVVTPDITGRAIASTLGMTDKVKALPRPLNIETLHVIVSKTHPQARTLLYYVNTALAKLKENGDYDHMVEKHLSHYWETYDPHKSAAGPQAVRSDKPGSSAEPEQRKSTTPQGGTSEPATSHARK